MIKIWCYHYISRLELRDGLIHDESINRQADASSSSVPDQLVERAWLLATQKNLLEQYGQIRQVIGSAMAVLLVLGLVAGGSAALAALGSGSTPVNVIWSLMGLLLMPTITLIVWLVSVFLPGAGAPWFGRIWQSMLNRFIGRSDLLDAWHAWLDMTRQAITMRLWMGLTSHLLWFALLLGGVVTMIAAFSLRHYTFLWETTWLSVDVFVTLASLIGAPAGWLGLSVPDATAIAASGNQALDDPLVRMQWANWLVGAIAVLGVLPRVVAASGCAVSIWARLRRQKPDSQSAYAQAVLAQIRHDVGTQLLDGPPGDADQFEPVVGLQDDQRDFSGTVVVGVDMVALPDWVKVWPALGIVDDRQSRQAVFDRLQKHCPERLLIVVDGGQTPDRGSVALVRDLAGKAGRARVFLQPRASGLHRDDLWRAKLVESGLQAPLSAQEQASDWLAGASI